MKQTKHYWSLFTLDQWKVYLIATNKGLCYIGTQDKKFKEVTNYFNSKFSDYHLERNNEKLQPYLAELNTYFQQQSTFFTFPLDINGTEFQLTVWNELRKIPYGRTLSYSQIASNLGSPNSARAVAKAISANPMLVVIPCHRVIGKNGDLVGYRGGIEMKKQLLELEVRKFYSDSISY
ncbi:methylated-DNA-[protein]-cysteine S-methyltransferase [Gracilibacillus orientalis]|uniref:methylated-DNA--[protein]-cysteine S-methyltransferase n=1 Tax=Gracilibacillus orientalis TaxID=334253 RepID=A0A1I4H467_9BACI|nr:methylated-DNA--[protein]-cysteine S-methyltransferase [Gracilibacillus orientalis]SFL36186.1 methylated-DNA-[protein]-cysteine S-methyltransferase [Gracilibacillus orientalis]